MIMTKLYLLSGLAATDYMFKNLAFPEQVKPVYLPWFENEADDSFETFASRIIDRYQMEKNQAILGLSFGGIMASEIQKQLPQKKIILISSLSHSGQLPVLYRMPMLFNTASGFIKRKDSLPRSGIAWPFQPVNEEDVDEVQRNITDVSEQHLLWVIKKVLEWNHPSPHSNVFHIHGTSDRVFPDGRIKADVKIKGGGHLMILNRSSEINEILKKELSVL